MTDEAIFRSVLEKVDRWLAENRPEYHAALRPGAIPGVLTRLEERFEMRLPSAFKLLYEWHDGQEESCFDSFERNRMFMPVADIASTKEMLDEMIGTDFDDPEWWQTGWIPFLANGGGDYLCVEAHKKDSERYGQIIAFWHADADRKWVFASLDDWLQRLWASMEAGTYRVV
jgi:cell wall assembly regulator SMI1